ncbi:MAG: dTDP-4-dehydrorhamnose reductase [Acidimicrobiales bacterium]
MKIAVIGGNGQLGSDVGLAFVDAGHEVVGLDHTAIEIVDAGSVERTLAAHRPDVVVNTAAMHNVEHCEQEPGRAFEVNGVGPLVLARASSSLGFKLIQISTDYVFDGRRSVPYAETDRPAPLNVYGVTKLSGEHAVLAASPRAVVVRTSGLYGAHPCRAKGGLNFVELMLKLGHDRERVRVVTDETVSPTYTWDLARQLVALGETEEYGLFHATSQGACTWNEFARVIFEIEGLPVIVEAATAEDIPQKVPRPKYSVLDNVRLRSLGLDLMPTWETAVRRYLERSDR